MTPPYVPPEYDDYNADRFPTTGPSEPSWEGEGYDLGDIFGGPSEPSWEGEGYDLPTSTEEPSTWDKIKKGASTAYDFFLGDTPYDGGQDGRTFNWKIPFGIGTAAGIAQ